MWRFLFFLLFCLPVASSWAANAISTRIDLAGHLSLLRDPGGQLSIDAVAASTNFQPLPAALSLGFTTDVAWLRIAPDRAHALAGNWLLEITHPHHDDVRLYTQSVDGRWDERRAGEDVPRRELEVHYRHAAFHLYLADSGDNAFYLRIASRNSILADLILWQPEAFSQAVQRETLVYGLFFGIYLAILISHLFFWRWTREPVSGWYATYVFMSLMIGLLSAGFFQQYVDWPSMPIDRLLAVFICGIIWVGTNFAIRQLDLASVMPRTGRVLAMGSGAVAAGYIALALGLRYSAGVVPAQLTILMISVVMLLLPLWLWRRGHPPARFFFFAFCVLYAGSALRYLSTLGILPATLVSEYGYQIGAAVHMLMMSLAITGRYNAMKRQVAVAQTRRADELEAEVLARTQSLVDEIAHRETLEVALRRALEVEQLARQEQRDFVAMVSHEFRTPLAIINTSAQQLASNLDAPREKSMTRCGNIRTSARRMTDLMDEYLSLDRMDDDTHPLQLDACDPEALIASVCAEWPAERIVLETENLPPGVVCDSRLLQITVRNLLANALRHAPNGVPVQLTATAGPGAQGGVIFRVSDAGSGIPADEIPKLFLKYFRGRAAQNEPGAGLGLYLVDRIAKLHGGKVSLTSSPGVGSTFELVIPAA
jgi:signal transduction histidine kinase